MPARVRPRQWPHDKGRPALRSAPHKATVRSEPKLRAAVVSSRRVNAHALGLLGLPEDIGDLIDRFEQLLGDGDVE